MSPHFDSTSSKWVNLNCEEESWEFSPSDSCARTIGEDEAVRPRRRALSLQIGHVEFVRSQVSMHSTWNAWGMAAFW